MNNIVEFKDWLFVQVPEDATDFMLLTKAGERDFWRLPDDVMNRIDLYANGVYNTPIVWLNLFGSYQIIGKGDQIDWEGIVEKDDVVFGRQLYLVYGNVYDENHHRRLAVESSTESGHSLLKSLGMEPSETFVLKKIRNE